MNRLKNKVSAHEKADNSFDETILGLLDIATQAGNIFDKSNNLELKSLLLKFVFESLTLTEGKLTYKLRFPFNEFVDNNILMKQVVKSHEPNQHLINQYLHGHNNENLQIGCLKSLELAESQKNVRLAKNFASLLQIGDATRSLFLKQYLRWLDKNKTLQDTINTTSNMMSKWAEKQQFNYRQRKLCYWSYNFLYVFRGSDYSNQSFRIFFKVYIINHPSGREIVIFIFVFGNNNK